MRQWNRGFPRNEDEHLAGFWLAGDSGTAARDCRELMTTYIYPGRQAGSACGAGLSGKPASTIGFEKRFNPMLSMSKDSFVDVLTAEIPPQPADMANIVEANLRGVAPVPEQA